jgi:hypothetical protein
MKLIDGEKEARIRSEIRKHGNIFKPVSRRRSSYLVPALRIKVWS